MRHQPRVEVGIPSTSRVVGYHEDCVWASDQKFYCEFGNLAWIILMEGCFAPGS